MHNTEYVQFNALQGLVLENILTDGHDEVLYFVMGDGNVYQMWHEQDCCEHVSIEDVVGDLRDLKGHVIVTAEEVADSEEESKDSYESCTWTFYKIGTSRGDVTIRWFGSSNGYYAEGVSFGRMKGAIPESAVEFVWKA